MRHDYRGLRICLRCGLDKDDADPGKCRGGAVRYNPEVGKA